MTQPYPDTLEAAAGRIYERILRGADDLRRRAETEKDAETLEFLRRAGRGARAYAELLQEIVADDHVDNGLLEQAELVAIAAGCDGWIGVGGAAYGREDSLRRLRVDGFLAYHPEVPGQWAACYRLWSGPDNPDPIAVSNGRDS